MNRALASVGIAAAVICGSAAPALAADNPIDAKITHISSGSSQVSSPVTVKCARGDTWDPNTTGTYAGFLTVLVPTIAAVGTIAYLVSRKEDN